jgi:hypothetical protein
MNTCTQHANALARAEAEFAKLVAEALQRGFYGTTSLVLNVQDGRIQHIRVAVEKRIQ